MAQVSGRFTVPANQPVGTATVEIIGDQGSRGTASYYANHTITVETRRIVTTVYQYYDPLAETFTLTEGRYVGAVDLWFTAKGSSRVTVQIRDTVGGFPGKNVLAQAIMYPSEINTNGNATRFTFKPVWLESDTEYAIVILTDDATTAVAISELGKYDSVHRNYVTKQPYQTGVLLSSSNASTWTAHQNMDLTFRLLACKFTETNYVVNLGEFTADDYTDLLLLGQIERVTTDTDVEFIVTDENGKEHVITEDSAVPLKEEISGNCTLKVRLKGKAVGTTVARPRRRATSTPIVKQSPLVYKGLQLLLGKIATTADYVTRAITAGTNSTVRVIYDSYTPGNSSVKVYYQQPDTTWTLIPLTSASPIGDGVEEHTHILQNYNQSTVKIKIVLEGNVLYRPYVKNLKVTTV